MAKRKKKAQGPKLRRSCGAVAAHMMLLERNPSFRLSQMRLEGATEKRRASGVDLKKAKIVTIKTVVNVVFKTAQQNISDKQIRSQITALNKDFRATNSDKSGTPLPWKGLITDPRLKFKLVKVTRTHTTKSGFTFDDAVKKASTGGIAPFSPKTHLNLWVSALTGGLLGYAQFPGGPPATDGVVINYLSFGTIGTAQTPFNKGRTATHEIGHYFNLRHIWGDTPDCSGSDMAADTPNCAGPNFGTPAWPLITCNNGPNGDMFMNYMDYTDDKAMFMFTAQQVLRMRTALDTTRMGLK
ncbi:MAG: zinc metalloprotease [Gemmatimonadota bacterium]